MKNYGKVKSTIKPNHIEIDEFSVWVNTNIKEIETSIEDKTETEYEYDMVQYEKDEYILKNDTEISDIQDALIELASIVIGE